MKENKTQKTNDNVALFLSSIEEEQKREDCQRLLEMMQEITKANPICGVLVSWVLGNTITSTRVAEKAIGSSLVLRHENKP